MDEIENRDPLAAIVYRDPTVSIMFGVALLLIVLISTGGAVFAATRHVELLEGSLVLTGLFAIAGIVFGLARSLRSERALRRRRA
jgi:hypothetical protein